MDQIGRGVIAGFLATLFISSVFHPIARIAGAGDINNPAVGWLLHFLVGTFLWGAAFGAVVRWLPGAPWLRGLVFGLAAWLVVMLFGLPLMRAGTFGVNIGMGTPAVMFGVHLAYGVLIGAIFGFLEPEEEHAAHTEHHHDDHWHPVAR